MANSEPSLPIDSSSFRAVVVDSLLCFVHNFRHLPHLRSVLIRHFPVPSFVRSLHLLTQLSPDPNDLLFPFCSSHSEDVHLLLHSLLLRFDRLSSSGQAPIFAASDLFSLPLRPNFVTSADTEIVGGENGTKMGRVAVEDELRHIRFMLQQIFWLQQQLPARQKNGSSNGSPSPFLDFAQQHCAVPSVTSSSAPPLSLFAQFGQSLFSSPECPNARPLPATTPKDGQTVATNGIVSSPPMVQNNRQTTTNSGKGMLSPSKSRGRLDNVVEKLTRERTTSRKGTTDEGKGDGGEERQQRQRSETVERERQNAHMEEAKNQRDEIDSEGKERQQQQRPMQQQNNAQHQQQVMGGVTTTINAAATMASSYAMRVLQQLAIGAGGLGGIMEGAQQRQMDEWQRGQATAQLTKRNELEEEEAEERDGPMLEEEEEEDEEEDEGDTFGNKTPSGERQEEGEERKRTDVEFGGQTMADSPTLSEGSLAQMSNGNDKEGEEKPLLCNWPNCFKRFRNKFLLKKHRFIHSGEKPHKCPFCPKKFNRRDNLLRHKKTHVQNGLSEQSGQKRRHNMLYGVSAEEALLSGMILPMDGGTSTEKQRRGTKRKAKCTERVRDDGTEQ